MGYSLYITRREHWHDDSGPEIALLEWQQVVESDATLSWEPDLGDHFATWSGATSPEPPWLIWDNGNLESKYPPVDFIRKMASLASQLNARVVGEEGELYGPDGVAIPGPTRPSRRAGFWSNLKMLFFSGQTAPPPPFAVGARVRGIRGRLGTVTKINLKSQGGMGEIRVRYDDGKSASYSAVAHILEPVGRAADEA
jgi:hypothetical protein